MAVAMPTVAQSPPGADQPLRMTYEEFQAWAGEDTHAEWVNGEVIVQMPIKEAHQNVVEFLHLVLSLFVRLFGLGRVHVAPFEMRAAPGGSAREPDLMFVAAEHLDRLSNDCLAGPADLVVEVISDDSVYRDRVDKFDEYEAAGVREYWMIDPRPDRRRAEFWVLDERGRYRAGEVSQDGVYRATALPGLWLRVEWLLAETLPDPLATLAQVAGPDRIMASLQG